MYNRKIKFLHIIKDDKFFDGVINAFESDERLENRSVLMVKSKNYKFNRIRQTEKVDLLWNKQMQRDCLCSSDYDVVFFHSLTADRYKYLQYIPKDKIVIWWCWGYDIYFGSHGMRPLVPLEEYKPITSQLFAERRKNILYIAKDLFCYMKGQIEKEHYYRLRRMVLSRVDFFQPVIPLEYEIMKNQKGFQAKEFYYPRRFTSYYAETGCIKNENGGILIGNSATYTNNHLDVWTDIHKYVPSYRNIIIPVNYGVQRYADYLSKEIKSKSHHIHFIREFMPRDEYFKLIDGCSYAVFGVIRQQALGNINYCLCKGIKVFLYRDSLVYRFLKNSGFVVFAIEDIDEESFKQPLTKNQLLQNKNAFEKEKNYIEQVRDAAFEAIFKRCTSAK